MHAVGNIDLSGNSQAWNGSPSGDERETLPPPLFATLFTQASPSILRTLPFSGYPMRIQILNVCNWTQGPDLAVNSVESDTQSRDPFQA